MLFALRSEEQGLPVILTMSSAGRAWCVNDLSADCLHQDATQRIQEKLYTVKHNATLLQSRYLRVAHFHALFLLCHFLHGVDVGLGIPLGTASCQPLH